MFKIFKKIFSKHQTQKNEKAILIISKGKKNLLLLLHVIQQNKERHTDKASAAR